MSTVKGLAWAAEKPCVGVSTLEAMAWHGLAVGGYICPVMDARRSQVYNALFKIENGRPVRMTEDRPIALEELAKEVTALGAPVFLIGDGAALCFEYFTAHGVPCVMAPDNLRWQDAWGVAMAAADKTPGNADELLPRTSALMIMFGLRRSVFSGMPTQAEPSATLNSSASTLPSARR